MGFWGAVVGGLLGGAVGGPWGAGLGAAVGSAFGSSEEQPAEGWPELPMQISWEDDQDGRFLILEPGFPLDGVIGFRVDLMDHEVGAFVSGHAPYRDDDGDFFVIAFVQPGVDFAHCYVPTGAAQLPRRSVVTRVLTLGEDLVFGASHFEAEWPRGRYERAHLLRPMIGLAMRVARADGHLDRSEVRHIRGTLCEAFELSASEQGALKALMKTEPSAEIQAQVDQIYRRFPNQDPADFIGLLAEVAHADGQIHAAEVEVIREVALAFGLEPAAWPDVAAEYGLVSTQQQLADVLAVFDLRPGATLREVKTAYRAKMRDYHPDKVAHLPPEFQQVAHTKSQELNDAFEALKGLLS